MSNLSVPDLQSRKLNKTEFCHTTGEAWKIVISYFKEVSYYFHNEMVACVNSWGRGPKAQIRGRSTRCSEILSPAHSLPPSQHSRRIIPTSHKFPSSPGRNPHLLLNSPYLSPQTAFFQSWFRHQGFPKEQNVTSRKHKFNGISRFFRNIC